jgi:hypothetical protein
MAIDSIPFPFHVSEVQITRADGVITEFPATTALTGTLKVLDGEAYLATMAPEQRELLDGKLRLLDSRMLTYYPVPAPDQLLSTKVGALTHDRPGAAVGSVVWTQVTNTGVMSFVLPNIRFNQQANTYEYLPMPEASIAPLVAPAAASASSSVDLVLSLVKIGAPLLPAPFGAVVGASTSLLQLILGTTKTSEDPVKATVEQLEQYAREQKLADWAVQLNEYASWLDDQVATLAATTCANTKYIETELRPTISDALSPNSTSSLLSIVRRLVSTQFPYIDPAAAEYSSNAVGLLQQGIALLFTYYKTLVQLEATIAANYFSSRRWPTRRGSWRPRSRRRSRSCRGAWYGRRCRSATRAICRCCPSGASWPRWSSAVDRPTRPHRAGAPRTSRTGSRG